MWRGPRRLAVRGPAAALGESVGAAAAGTTVSVRTDTGLDPLTRPTERTPTFAEQLTSAAADAVLFSSYGTTEDSGHAVEDDVFFTGIGLTAANLIVDLTDRLG